ncbi:MAG: hypothetical protein PHO27_07965 [Sulfuricurvum sp.]|nr:hypothetical protein [Sulfuricurvum sp.]
MIVRKVCALIGLTALAIADPYTLGQGISLGDSLTVGGYFSTEYDAKPNKKNLSVEDVAIMAYGDINSMFSYFGELESVGFYNKSLLNGDEKRNFTFRIERLYSDMWMSDAFNIRFGKQITPIGYWNKEPVNVLRDTTSNPLYSTLLFPRFLTGIDINGYVPNTQGLKYHLFGQNNHDFDDEYVNIPNTHFFGISVEKELNDELSGGGSVGEYITFTNQKTRYMQVSSKFDDGTWQFLGEALAAKSEYTNNQQGSALSGYLQGMYRYTSEHAVVGRYEYFNDHHSLYKDNIGVLGYSYRPLYPVSLKGEYQWHSLNSENRLLFSFSVLF